MTIRELLVASIPYQIPDAFYDALGEEVGTDLDDEVSDSSPVTVNRARARLYIYLATVPNVSEGGVSISFTADDKKAFWNLARRFANLAGETGLIPGTVYGYKGQNI